MARPLGVPKIQLEEQVEKLAMINCSWVEIAAVIGLSEKTCRRRFDQAYKNGLGKGRSSLKRKMYEVAMKGNATMMIWLSKNMLGYADKVETKTDEGTTQPRVVIFETSLGSSSARDNSEAKPLQPASGSEPDTSIEKKV